MPWTRVHPIEDEETTVALARDNYTPGEIATKLNVKRPYVYYVLSKHGIDWIRSTEPKSLGRPQKPLLIGQQLLIEHLYARKHPQYDIAAVIGASLPRVRRHLISRGLYAQGARRADLTPNILAAIADYLEGTLSVTAIVAKHGLSAPTFYAALHNRGIALRGNPGRPKRRVEV
jgi:hypothetical protein